MLFPNRSKSIVFVGMLVAVAALFGFFGYLYMMKSPPLVDYRSKQQSEAVQQDAKVKITPDTNIIQKMVYQKCGDEEMLRAKPSEAQLGLTLTQFQAVYPGWTIEHFDAVEVRMSLQVDSFCRDHANAMYIGVQDGFVAVYYGRPGMKPIIKEVTKIPISNLVAEDAEELRKGIIVNSKEELLRTLEGLSQ